MSAEPKNNLLRRYTGDAALGVVITLVFAAVAASFAAAGLITMGAALGFLIFAFVVIMTATVIFDHLWEPSTKLKISVGVISIIALGIIGIYEWKNYTPPLSAREIASDVIKALGDIKKESDTSPADVSLRFVYPTAPALLIMNQSDSVAKDIKYVTVVWNMDDQRVYLNAGQGPDGHDPLPIPVQGFDYLKPHGLGGPLGLFATPQIIPFIKERQRLFGSVAITCINCAAAKTYIFYDLWGKSGWYYEVPGVKDGRLIIPKRYNKELVRHYFENTIRNIPDSQRLPILDQ